ncbi:hypothetical protein [uncultured Jatrophihabitans sp.]|uniref:hypothetical protein n=1 Tax=uncultured Jatrophihabitans sp. TaxID=1610747 RepID=UPI0035C9A3D1
MNIWFTARGAGLSALVLVTASICLGALGSRMAAGHPQRRYVVQYLHRVCGSLGIVVLVLHVATILADSYAHVGWRGAVIPFTSGYRPTWIALGSLAAYTLVFAAVLGAARGRLAASSRGAALWRTLHALSYGAWAAALVHGFESGTDSSLGWVRAIYVTCLVAVVGATAARLVPRRRTDAPRRQPTHVHTRPEMAGAPR